VPKMKTHRGAAKRFRVTAGKKIMKSKSARAHLMAKKTSKRKRRLRLQEQVSAADRKRLEKLLPYS